MLVGLRSRRSRVRTPVILPPCSVNHFPFHMRGRNDSSHLLGLRSTRNKRESGIAPESDASKKKGTVFLWSQLLTIA